MRVRIVQLRFGNKYGAVLMLLLFSASGCRESASQLDQGHPADAVLTDRGAEHDAGPRADAAALDTLSADMPTPDLVSHSCPPWKTAPYDGDSCNHLPSLSCEGKEDIETCNGTYGGQRKCTCTNGRWCCPNIFCASFCPATVLEAKKGPACTKKACDGSVCYYGFVLCGCQSGKLDCQ